ncbi:PKD domain-containing protein [Polaribacter vadi]|uniref:PKD domain-containing protein n=1 Tax=Polaribacter vadi TaxID=1774273 RepID=UPI0030EE36C1|tara:strand:+ start:16722 stop:18236 length:1515 start_codon:yes stop_codon:yes gene_type:complete
MIYKLIKKFYRSLFALLVIFISFASCYDSGYEEFVPPTGNVNNIQPTTLFTATTNAENNLGVIFRSYSTDAASYLWDFGDGNSSTEANPDYVYNTGGLYQVKLTTTSAEGLVGKDSTNVAPVFVDYSFTTVDSQVTFTNNTEGAASLVWDFGDGESVSWEAADTQTDSDFSPIHTYATADVFDVTLTVTNFLGREITLTKRVEGLVLAAIPDFSFSSNGLRAEFTDESLLAESYSWDFGDGTTSTEKDPVHIYAATGTYDVTLTITNSANVERTITKAVPIGGVKPTFKVIVLNGTGDEFQGNTGDNADAWDMTPNSTVVDDTQGTIDSPYRELWNNSDLDSWLDTNCGDNSEQPGSTSDGNKFAGLGDRGLKLDEACRRLYQVVTVEVGVEYTFTIQSRSESADTQTEVFILNNEITGEDAINTVAERDANADAYYLIDNDFNGSKASSSDNTFTTTTFSFKPSTTKVVIYIRSIAPNLTAPDVIDGTREVFYDNIDIITPGF